MDRKKRACLAARRVFGPIEKFLRFLGRPIYIILVSSFVLSLSIIKILHAIKKNTKRFLQIPPLRFPNFPRRVLFIGSGIVTFLLLVFYCSVFIFRDLPSPIDLQNHQPKLTTHILDHNGQELYKIYRDENRSLVALDQLPEYVIDATVAIEDKEFWNHAGFSFSGIARAFRYDMGKWFGEHPKMQGNTLQGGSTITQQLVKNTLLSNTQTFTRKVREIILSIWIERTFTKKQILQMYLNEVSYGGTAYGIQEASEQYFGKNADQLTLGEASLLAGLPAAPTSYSPLGVHPERAKERQTEVLRRMVEDKYISKEEAEQAKSQELIFTDGSANIKAPHFVMYVHDLLAEKYGEAMVNHGGLKVTTTLDLPIQDFVTKTVHDEVLKLTRLHVSNGAALVINPKNGDILAMVGSKDYFDFKHDGQVNVTARPRQPGSSIKPANYAAALQHGFTPASIILDEPISFPNPGSKPYTPVNYDGKFHGPVPLRTALGSSYNIPAVKVLSTIGVDTMIDQAEKMGIKTWGDRKRFGLSLTLGGGEVTMLDMAEMYGTLANYGIHIPLDPILKIEDSNGKVLYQKNEIPSSERALPAIVAYQLTDILSDPAARAPAFGTHSVLNIPIHQVAVKTGTTNSLRDNWTFGYTTDLVVATWVGNNDNSPMSYIASGITGASPIWAIIMKELLADRTTPHVFLKPEDVVTAKICTLTGQLSCDGCPAKEEIFLPGTEPKESCRPETIQDIKNKQQEIQKRDQILQGVAIQR